MLSINCIWNEKMKFTAKSKLNEINMDAKSH